MKQLTCKAIRAVAVAALISTLVSGFAQAATAPEVVKGTAWLQAQVLTDGTLANEAASIATPLQNRAESLQTFKLLATVPSTLADQLAADTADNTEYLARRAVTLSLAGRDASAIITQLAAKQNADGGFGGNAGYTSSALNTTWVMMAMAQNTQSGTPAAQKARSYLLASIQPDGGVGTGSDSKRINANALALLALQMYPQDLNTATALKQISGWLLLKQGADGSWLGNSDLTALSLAAVSPLISDPTISLTSQTYLKAQQGADGSWGGGDPFLTAVVLRALTMGAPAAAATSSITGQVNDQNTATALAGATVALSGASTATLTTGIDGKINFASLAAGSYTLQISKAGYTPYTNTYQLNTSQTLNIGAIALAQVPATGIVSGQITAAATGQPLIGVTVTLNGATTAVTDANGLYSFANVAPGAVTVSASLAGYAPSSSSGNVLGGQTLVFSPALYVTGVAVPTTGHFIGKVIAAGSNTPLAGVAIQLNGAAAGVTAADGSFDLIQPPASYTAAFTLAGYNTATATFLLTAGTTVNAGAISLTPQLTATTISGVVKDATSGSPISGAQVQVLNGAVVTTGTNGAYSLTGLAGTTFDLRVSATGYVSQSVQLMVSQPSNITQDFPLQVQTGLGLSLGALMVSPGSAGSGADISIGTIVSNAANGTPVSVVLTMQVLNAQGRVVSSAIAYDKTGKNMLGQISLNPGQQLPVMYRWNTGQFPAGSYTLVAQIIEAGTTTQSAPAGRVLVTGQGTLSIITGLHFSGSVTADPPVLQVGANTPVHLSAILINDGNADLPAQAYQLKIIDENTGLVVATQQANGTAFSPFALQSLTFADWTPAAGGGNFRIELQAAATPSQGKVIGKVYVGDAATASFTVNKLAVTAGTQAVKGSIHVSGQDNANGTISDPLAPLIKTAVQKAVTYNDAQASNWYLTYSCLGCHVVSQALVGGEGTRNITTFNATQRQILLDAITTNQHVSGAIFVHYMTDPDTPRISTILGLWGLNGWHNKSDVISVMAKAADFLLGQQDADGGWTTDYLKPPSGWWSTRAATTGVTMKSLVDIDAYMKQSPNLAIYTFQPQTQISGTMIPGAAKAAAVDAAGNIYVTSGGANYFGQGTLSEVKPDGTVQTLLTGLNMPRPPVFASDGSLYIPSYYDGVIRYSLATGKKTTLTTTGVTTLALGPDGNMYGAALWSNKIIQITPAGVVSDYIVGGGLNYPYAIAFDKSGAMLVSNPSSASAGNMVKYNADKTYSVILPSTNAIYYILPVGSGYLVATSNGLFRYDSAWQGTQLKQGFTWSLAQTPDGKILVGDSSDTLSVSVLRQVATPVQLDASISNATNWLLVDSNTDSGNNIDLAFRLIGMGSAKQHYSGTPMAATLQTKMDQVGALLRSRQQADGGWGWTKSTTASDSMITAMVGVALDYLNPSASDPVVQNAVKLLLSRQQFDGSWISENGVLTTHLAATTWVAIWLPIALDRIGGINTDMTVSMPANVTLANPSVAPTSSAANAAGGVDYLWKLQGVKSAGLDINFDLSLANMVLNETRPVASNAYLTFNNTFTQQPVTAPITIPRVTASAFLGLGVTTDQTNYGANTPVNITAAVNNTSAGPLDGSVKLEIYGADGILTAVVGTQPFTALAAGAQTSVNATWGTGTIAAGGYYVLATLYDAQNRQAGTAQSTFNIISGIGATPAATGVGATITADKPAYQPIDRVQLTSRITNLTQNQVQTGLQAVVTIYRPDGTTLWTQTAPLQQLLAGAFLDLGSSTQLSAAPAGQYTVALSVQTAGAVEIAKAGTTFTVLSSALTGSGLKGTISAFPKIVPQTDPVILNWTASDLGNADFTALPITINIVDPATNQLMAQQAFTITVAQGQTYQTAYTWATDPASVGATYVAILTASVAGKTIVLAQDNFLVTEPPVRLDVTQSTVRANRILVWLACNPADDQKTADNQPAADNQKNGNDQKAGDPKDQAPIPACIKARTAYLQTLLAPLNAPYLITTNQDDFRKAFREGKYNVYWLSGDTKPGDAANKDATNKDSANKDSANKDGANKDGANKESDGEEIYREIREAVNRGDGLILEGAQQAEPMQEAAGLTYNGKLPRANTPLTTTGLLFAAGTMPTQGSAQKMRLATGISQANFNVPAKADDPQNTAPPSDAKNTAQQNDGQQKNDVQNTDGQNTVPAGDDTHKPAPAWPAIVSNDYGKGHALAFGFDLTDTLQNSAAPAAWSALLQTGLTHILPPLPDTYSAGAYVEMNTLIQNLARTVDLSVNTQLPPGVTLLQTVPNAALDANGQPTWLFTLPEAANQTLQLSMRLPYQSGGYTARTYIDSIRNGKNRRYREYDYNWTVAASDPLAGKLANDLNGLTLKLDEEIEARDATVAKLKRAMANIAQAEYGKALQTLLEAVDNLRKITSVDTSGYRLVLDSLLQETAWNWLRTGGDPATPDAQPPEKDAQQN